MAIRIYTQPEPGQQWLQRFRGQQPLFACVLGFTETGLIPGISAAGATPADRRYTAIADAEFLYHGPQLQPTYPLPPLDVGASPVLISRAVVEAQQIPLYLFNAGLPHPPAVPAIDLGGMPARCLSQGQAMTEEIVEHLFQQGLRWGEKLAARVPDGYLLLGECVVGGTTTALAVLTGLGMRVSGQVNSSHSTCNHQQKWQLVQRGLEEWATGVSSPTDCRTGAGEIGTAENNSSTRLQRLTVAGTIDPLCLVAAVGDPMQVVVAAMAIAASQRVGVLLAGGTQMLAVYALARAIVRSQRLDWQSHNIIVGTTRWVAEDPTGDTVGLANLIGDVPLVATQLSFAHSRYEHLRAYERGYVKEGVGAGGCAIAAELYQGWQQERLAATIDDLAARHGGI